MKYLCLIVSFIALLISLLSLPREETSERMTSNLMFILDQTSRREIKAITNADAVPFVTGSTSNYWRATYAIEEYEKTKLTEIQLKNALSKSIQIYLKNSLRLEISVELVSYDSSNNEISLKFNLE